MIGKTVKYIRYKEELIGVVLDKYSDSKIEYVDKDNWEQYKRDDAKKIPIAVKDDYYIIQNIENGKLDHVLCSAVKQIL